MGKGMEDIGAGADRRPTQADGTEPASAAGDGGDAPLDILSVCPLGVIAIGANGKVVATNSAFTAMTGLGREELMGLGEIAFNDLLRERCDPEGNYRACENRAVLKEIGTAKGSVMVLGVDPSICGSSRNGACSCDLSLSWPKKRRLRRSASFIDDRHHGRTRVLFFQDVSQEHATESLKSEFIVAASHELRTPLTMIYGYAESLLVEEHDAKTQIDMLRVIARHGKNLARVLDDLLDLARLEDQISRTLPLVRVDLAQWLLTACGEFEYAGDPRRPGLTMGEGRSEILGDAGLLGKCLHQLLANAYRYSFRHGQITVALHDAGGRKPGWTGFTVADEGIGMSEEEQARVFERFWRAETSGKNLGTGLGMSLVKEIVELHRGRIEIQSAPGKGTQVSILLPLLP